MKPAMKALSDDAPIGVFDSGVGGLSVLQAIRTELPLENLMYLADSGYAPYGDRDADFIADRATAITEFLLAAGVKAIVIACNTATVVAVAKLRAWCPVPVIAMEPAIKPAVLTTRSGSIGVLATSRTLASPSVAKLCATYGNDVKIFLQPCPGLVEQVEKAELHSPDTHKLLVRYLSPLLEAGVDTLVLGCTHYPFLISLIRDIAGHQVTIIDPATAIARELSRRLGETRRRSANEQPAGIRFFTSAAAESAGSIISTLLGEPVTVEVIEQAAGQGVLAPSEPRQIQL